VEPHKIITIFGKTRAQMAALAKHIKSCTIWLI